VRFIFGLIGSNDENALFAPMKQSAIKLQPEWLSVATACDYSSLSRTELFRICTLEDVVSIHKIKPGNKKGIRLINRASLDAYMRSFLPGGSRYQVLQEAK
jgi:hypothetical protein